MNKTLGMQRPVSSVLRSSYITEFWLDEKSAPDSLPRLSPAQRKETGWPEDKRRHPAHPMLILYFLFGQSQKFKSQVD